MHLLCYGLGYTALELCKLDHNFQKITGTKRVVIHYDGVDVRQFDSYDVEEDVTHILISIPPDAEGDLVFRKYITQIAKLKNLQWIGYISTTGVYGDHRGNWVDESTPTDPKSMQSINRLTAENQWKSTDLPWHIFRVGAIYGPGRNAVDRITAGEKIELIEKENQYFSRIHVRDLAGCLLASQKNPTPYEIYNLVDDEPSSSLDVNIYAYQLLNLPLPKIISFEEAKISSQHARYYLESRKVRNEKVKNILHYKFQYPSYKDGMI